MLPKKHVENVLHGSESFCRLEGGDHSGGIGSEQEQTLDGGPEGGYCACGKSQWLRNLISNRRTFCVSLPNTPVRRYCPLRGLERTGRNAVGLGDELGPDAHPHGNPWPRSLAESHHFRLS